MEPVTAKQYEDMKVDCSIELQSDDKIDLLVIFRRQGLVGRIE
jgi:hypothetical protein